MGAAETLRQLIDAGKSSKRLDELSSARVIGKVALQVHAVQQKAGAGKAVGPITPNAITFEPSGDAKYVPSDTSSFGYSSPEQLTGSGDRRSDVFSLGAVLWEVLTYQRLFDAMNDAAVKIAVKDREITPPAELNANVPAELSAICMRALARNPSDRYQSLKAMAVEIEEFLSEAGYDDNDDKIALHLTQLPKTLKIELPSIHRSPGGTQPPPMSGPASASTAPTDRPAGSTQPPSFLTTPPVADPPKSGAKLAAALATAGTTPPANASATKLPAASSAATIVGVASASDWQDNGKPAAHAAPPSPAPAASASQSIAVATTEPAVPLVPMAPILPGQAGRLDRATILTSVPPQVKVATNVVEAKHADSKPTAQIVEDKPKAVIVDEPVVKPEAPPIAAPIAKPQEPKADAKKPSALTMGWDAQPDPSAKANDTKPDAKVPAKADDKKADAKAEEKKVEAKADDKAKVEAKTDDKKPDAKVEATTKRADDTGSTKRDKKSTGEQKAKRDKKSTGEQKRATGPSPVAAVSLGPAPRDSTGDVLAGWGWGTDKHNAIAPDDYAGLDEDVHAPPDSKKTLTYLIGGGVAFVALVMIIALVAGGSTKPKKKKSNQPVAAVQTTEARDAVPTPTPPPTDTTPPTAGSAADPQGSAMAAGSAGSALDPAAQKAAEDQAAADKAAADKAAADKAAADKAAADKAAADKAAAEQAAVDKKAQEASAAEQAAADKKAAEQAAADKKAQDKAAAAQALADKKAAAAQTAAEKKAAAEEKARALAEKRAADKAVADQKAKELAEKRAADKAVADQKAKELAEKRAADRAVAAEKKAAADKLAAEKAKTTPKTTRPATTGTKATTSVAKADKVDVETAYKQGLQLYARGDTAGALASLRTSLAANPNYAPTWRGLGLVFEKMGEKEQARSAYKRYLQLAPGASDTEQIKGRLERLGS